jgi:hypothetical protein
MPSSARLLGHSSDLLKPKDVLEEGFAVSWLLVVLHKVSYIVSKNPCERGYERALL